MSTYQAKLDLFWKKMSDCPYELPDEMKPHVEVALKAAGFDQVVTVQGGGGGSTVSGGSTPSSGGKTKRLSGYNVYMKEKSAELKTQNVPSGERMGKIAAMWKALQKSEQEEYKSRAAGLVASGATTSPLGSPAPKAPKKGSGQLTGYQFFMKEKMAELKTQNVAGTERMGKVAVMWKALGDAEKKSWSEKAKSGSPTASVASTATAATATK